MNSFVLKHVSEPPKIIMASTEATLFSFIIFFISLFALQGFGYGFGILKGFIVSILIFFITQGFMIYKTMRDPFFLKVWMANLACHKTKNLYRSQDNHFGD